MTNTFDQMKMMRLVMLVKSMELYLDTGIKTTRIATPTRMREIASEFTGKEYPRSNKGLRQAFVDVQEIYHSVNNQVGV